MATRKTAAQKSAENATTDVPDVNDIPGLSEDAPETPENVTDETANDENGENGENGTNDDEEEDISPLDEEMDNIPHTNNDAVNALMPVLATQVVRNCEAQQIILNNTLSPEGIANFANTDSDSELVKARNEVAARNKDIDKLKAQITALEEANKVTHDVALKRAESIMSKQLKPEEKEKAKSARDDSRKQINNTMGFIKGTLMTDWQNVKDVADYFTTVNRRVFGGQTQLPTGNGARKTTARRRWTARAREWALNNNIEVSDRGRLPEDVREAYVKLHPNDPEPEA